MSEFWKDITDFLTKIMPGLVPVLLLFFVAILVITIVLLIKYKKINSRTNMFFSGEKAETYEAALRRILEDNRTLKAATKENASAIRQMNGILETTYRKIGVVKYNAFSGMAGKISSSVCFLNNENNGIIINSMHGPEGCYVYVKEIMNGKSVTALTAEDEEALKSAMEMQI